MPTLTAEEYEQMGGMKAAFALVKPGEPLHVLNKAGKVSFSVSNGPTHEQVIKEAIEDLMIYSPEDRKLIAEALLRSLDK